MAFDLRSANESSPSGSAPGRGVDVANGLIILAVVAAEVLAMEAAWPPHFNEAHYFCRAKAFWNADWIRGDLFLDSFPAHGVFYATVGALTRVVSLEAAAYLGRLLGWMVVASGWVALYRTIQASRERDSPLSEPGRLTRFVARWGPCLSLIGFLSLQQIVRLSGEWIIGGCEAKLFAYGLLAWSLSCRRLPLAAACAGGAVAFHPVVGIWGVLCALFAWAAQAVLDRWRCAERVANSSAGELPVCSARSPTRSSGSSIRLTGAMFIFLAISLCGVVPAIAMMNSPVDRAASFAGTFIQVYYRLAHHLDPMTFSPAAGWAYAAMLVVWTALAVRCPAGGARRFFRGVVLGAVLCFVAGWAIGWGPRPAVQMTGYAWRMALLKFYPFRLADVLIPLALALEATLAVATFDRWTSDVRRCHLRKYAAIAWCAVAVVLPLFAVANMSRQSGHNVEYQQPKRGHWIAACRWIRDNLPADALVQTPHYNQDFKWFAERAEFVAYKDCPQNAAGIVEWNRRLSLITKRYDQFFSDGRYDRDEMRAWRNETGVTHLLTERPEPFQLEPVHRNDWYAVFDLRDL